MKSFAKKILKKTVPAVLAAGAAGAAGAAAADQPATQPTTQPAAHKNVAQSSQNVVQANTPLVIPDGTSGPVAPTRIYNQREDMMFTDGTRM